MTALLPSRAYVRVLGQGETVQAGGISLPSSTELDRIRVLLCSVGARAGSEQVRAVIYSDEAYTLPLYTSDWSDISDIPNIAANWWGWLSLNFDRQNLLKNTTYYVGIQTANYTESDSNYLGVSLDWPAPTNTQSSSPSYGLAMEVYGYRDIT